MEHSSLSHSQIDGSGPEVSGDDDPLAVRRSYDELQSKSALMEEHLLLVHRERDEAIGNNADLRLAVQEVSAERDSLRRRISEIEASFKAREDEIAINDDSLAEQRLLRRSYDELRSKSASMEENLVLVQKERDEAIVNNADLRLAVQEISEERDSLRQRNSEIEDSFKGREDELKKKITEVEFASERIEKLEVDLKKAEEKIGLLLRILDCVRPGKDCFKEIIECLDDEKSIERVDDDLGTVEIELDEESRAIWEEFSPISTLASEAKAKVDDFIEKSKNEKRELESSIVSLTEENRDINSLLRVALLEKEAAERKVKGNNEQKRVALLQIAERGLQRVGFGFMMGSGSIEQPVESLGTTAASTTASTTGSVKSDSSECEEEISLASTVEKIMKNLRLEITQLRKSLGESRSDNERLQSLTEKQSRQIEDQLMYIKDLEDRERVLAQNVEELLMEIKETEEEVSRWREACELEVEAGKNEIEERDKVVAILKQELERTKAALEISNGKLKLKEELAKAAMAAQAAAEKSLQLADIRANELQNRIEELRKQLEEAESRERSRRKVRHICWPWQTLKQNLATNPNPRYQNKRLKQPEMQALLQNSF